METIHPDWTEFLQLLNSKGVKYLVVGRHAFGYHATPRYTADLDLFFVADEPNCQLLVEVLRDFGFGSDSPAPSVFLEVSKVFMIGRVPFRIDLLNSISGVEFDEAWEERVSGTLGGVPVSFIGRDALLKNKIASGRDKDLSDIKALEHG